MVGELIAGRYEVQELVGSGGMSSVFLAYDRLLERKVALKILHAEFSTDGDYVERFRHEARAVAQLSHPNIVTVIDRGEEDGRPFIVFEFVVGENLKELVAREGPLRVRDALEIGLHIARALDFAHRNSLVHRDVKPQNVLLAEDGRAKVTDFGIARSVDVETITDPGTVLGTTDYLAPEQARGEQVDAQTDVYSLGVVLYELLTGDVPYTGDNFVAVALKHLHEQVPSARERRPDLPPRLDALVRKAMAKEPRDRFGSMDEFVAELEACRTELDAEAGDTMIRAPTPVPAAAPAVAAARTRRRSRLLLPLAAAALVLAAAAAALAVFFATRGSDEPAPGASPKPRAVQLRAVTSYDPEGDDVEHSELAGNATDASLRTAWKTERYNSFGKNGVGLVLDAGRRVTPAEIIVATDTPAFTASIRAGSSPTGPFPLLASSEQIVGGRTVYPIRDNVRARYFLVWITDLGPNDSVDVNNVQAR